MKKSENSFFMQFGALGHPQIDPKRYTGLQVGRMYVSMFMLENRLLTISLSPSFRKK
jgi:hypothetical protein